MGEGADSFAARKRSVGMLFQGRPSDSMKRRTASKTFSSLITSGRGSPRAEQVLHAMAPETRAERHPTASSTLPCSLLLST